jgi:hypothetical protein
LTFDCREGLGIKLEIKPFKIKSSDIKQLQFGSSDKPQSIELDWVRIGRVDVTLDLEFLGQSLHIECEPFYAVKSETTVQEQML